MRPKWFIRLACAAVAVLLPNPELTAWAGELTVPEPGQEVEREIRSGETHVYTLTDSGGSLRRLVLDQDGIDVVAVLVAQDDIRPAQLNAPLGRFDREVFLLDGLVERLEVRPLEGGVDSGSYKVSLEVAGRIAECDENRRQCAELRSTQAARLPLGGSSEDMRRAAELYEEAAAGFAEVGDRREEARALLSAANFRRRLDQAGEAHRLYDEALTHWKSLDERGFLADSLVGLGQSARRLGRPERARTYLEEALALWEELGRGPERASTLNSLGLLSHVRGNLAEALGLYRKALGEHRRAGQRFEQANLLLNIGSVHSLLGDAGAALENETRGLELFRELGDRHGVLDSLNNLAVLHRRMGEFEEALVLYDQAHASAVALADLRAEATALNNRGFCYLGLGELDRAGQDFERALVLRREIADPRGELATLANLGDVEYLRGRPEAARKHLEAALELARRLQDRKEIRILGGLGRLSARLGDPTARSRFEQARALLTARSNPLDEARLFFRQGQALLYLDDPDGARQALDRALALWESLDDGAGQVMALTALGRTERVRGRSREALGFLKDAVERLESLRTELANPNLRATFLASRRDAYGLLVDVLMDLHALDPGAGHHRDALELSERARARRLLDLLAEAEVGRVTAPELEGRRRDLVRNLSLLVRRRQLVELGRRKPVVGENLAAAISDVHAELDLVEGEIRRQDPHRAIFVPATDLTTEAVEQLADPGTVMLHYALGEQRSYLWTVTSSGVESHELAPRREIEREARRFHEASSALDPALREARWSNAVKLAEMILEPAAERLHGTRLVVLADGALHYVPFAALPLPGGPSEGSWSYGVRVVERFETVQLASATVLARRRASARGATSRERSEPTVAILADPVFDHHDPRFSAQAIPKTSGPGRSAATVRDSPSWPAEGFGRLPGSRLEAEAISQWVPRKRRFVALGFDASRDALGADLASSSIVHFATHGMLDTEHPELSGLVLAQFDADGRRRSDGFLRVHDVYGLDLDAELVVLSGCRTGLGRELRGEGFLGLTSSFLYAGAQRVMVSLWSVADQATAELMRHFYRGLLAEGMRPAEALRHAQLAMAADRRFRDPYYWAAFVLQGDWR